MRYPASEKLEIIRLVEQSHLSVRRTLDKLGIPRTTFYRWYDLYQAGGVDALEDKSPRPGRVWNRIPDKVRDKVIDLALTEPELAPRELAVRFTDTQRYFVSESSVYRLLKAHVRGVYSTSEGLDLSRIPEFVELPPQSQATLTKRGYWYLNASVQQYLYEDPSQPGTGWGVFAYAAIADGNPNVLRWTIFAGLAGNNPLPARNMDKWGIGYFRYGLSDDLIDGLDAIGIDIWDEEGVEAFYNLAVTPWMRLTADIQWINPFQSGNDDAVIGILRARTLF